MWITGNIEIPEALIEAQDSGNIVYFVGAGASVDAPSSLPMFGRLAKELADLADVEFDDSLGIDEFLGNLPQDFNAHEQTSQILSHPNSSPNRTHKAIVSLASASGPARIVTTNFDNHLAEAAKEHNLPLGEIWCGPALPLGGDFTGIVHLHGSILKTSRSLVLTDEDFGAAYLYHGWATKFLLDMFSKHTVVFIGYSHDDPIMRYLALPLPKDTPRFAFVGGPSASDLKWRRLGVVPVPYPVENGSHVALVEALEAWSSQVRLGRADHRARMDQIAKTPSNFTPVDRDYVLRRLSTPEGLRHFITATSQLPDTDKVFWLKFMEDLDQFKSLFRREPHSTPSKSIAFWFAENYIGSSTLNVAALYVVQRLGQTFSEELFMATTSVLHRLRDLDHDSWRRWSTLLSTSIIGYTAPALSESVLPYDPEFRDVHISLLRAACRPYLKLERPWSVTDTSVNSVPPAVSVVWQTESDALVQLLDLFVTNNDTDLATAQAMLEDCINSAYAMLYEYNGDEDYDQISARILEIDPMKEWDFGWAKVPVVDAYVRLCVRIGDEESHLIERLWRTGRLLYKRIALYLLATDKHRSEDEKIHFIVRHRLLFAKGIRPEVFGLIESSISGLSEAGRTQLLASAVASCEDLDRGSGGEKYSSYRLLSLLKWMLQFVEDWPEVIQRVEEIETRYPELVPDEHPDKEIVVTGGIRGKNYPYEIGEFESLIRNDADRTIRELVSREFPLHSFEQTEWSDVLGLVRASVTRSPQLGLSIWDSSDNVAGHEERAFQLRCAVIDGWSGETFDLVPSDAIERVWSLSNSYESVSVVCRFLLARARSKDNTPCAEELSQLKELAKCIWQKYSERFEVPPGWEPGGVAPLYLNSWPGELAQFWVAAIGLRWLTEKDSWTGLAAEESEALLAFIRGPEQSRPATLPAIGESLHLLSVADREFSKVMILPLLATGNDRRLLWSSYLYHPRYDDKMLADGLYEAIVEQWKEIGELSGSQMRNQFYSLTFAVLSFSGIADGDKFRLLNLTVTASEGHYAVDFARAVVRQCLGAYGYVEELWSSWIRSHLERRLKGLPRDPADSELMAWADLLPLLGDLIPSALELFLRFDVGFDSSFQSPHSYPEMGELSAMDLEKYLVHRVGLTNFPEPRLKYRLNFMLSELRSALGRDLSGFEKALNDAELLGPI